MGEGTGGADSNQSGLPHRGTQIHMTVWACTHNHEAQPFIQHMYRMPSVCRPVLGAGEP